MKRSTRIIGKVIKLMLLPSWLIYLVLKRLGVASYIESKIAAKLQQKEIAREISPVLNERINNNGMGSIMLKTWLINEMDKRQQELALQIIEKEKELGILQAQLKNELIKKNTAIVAAVLSCASNIATAIITYFAATNS